MRPEGLREHWPILTGHRRAVSVSGWEPAPSVIQGASALAKDLPVSSRLERPPNFVACPSRGDSAKVGNGHVSVVGWRKFHVCCKHRLAARAIVERFVKLPKYGGADLLMIEAGQRDHGNRLAVNQPSKKPIRRLAFCFDSIGTPGAIRTPDPLVRSQVLYPAELRAPCRVGAQDYTELVRPAQALFGPTVWTLALPRFGEWSVRCRRRPGCAVSR
jgi:hypothetical protein